MISHGIHLISAIFLVLGFDIFNIHGVSIIIDASLL